MFCPKCGNELPEGAKFCAVCDTRIIKAAVEESTVAQQGGTGNRSTAKKTILLGAIALVAILAIVLIFKVINKPSDSQETGKNETIASKNTESGFDSYEDAIDALFTAAYNKDVEAVVNCFPEEMESHVKKLYNSYHAAMESGSGWSGDLLNYTTGNFFAFEKLNMENEYWYEIGETTELEQSYMYEEHVSHDGQYPSLFTKDELQTEYGLTFDEAYIVEVDSMAKYYVESGPMGSGYVTNGCCGYFEVAKIGGKWYVLGLDYAFRSDWYE